MIDVADNFAKRWQTIEAETLSSVRRQLKTFSFETSKVNKDFQKSCDEWFQGALAPALWYNTLSQTSPEKAQVFKQSVKDIQLQYVDIASPSKLWAVILTIVSIPVAYFALGLITEWEMLGKAVFTIGICVLTWTICQTRIFSQQKTYEENIVAGFKEQLDNHCAELKKILS